jgi:hypothetical protein
VFGAAALANYSPRRGIGFVRSLVVTGIAAILVLFVTEIATLIFGLGPQSYTSDFYRWLRSAIFIVLFVGSAMWFPCRQMPPSGREE